MHSKPAQNLVLFCQLRENGFKCTWKGLQNMAVHELVTVCALSEDEDTFQERFELFFPDSFEGCEDLASNLLRSAYCEKLLVNAVISEKKCHLLYELFEEHSLKAFIPSPSPKEVIHEILNICDANNCGDMNGIAKKVLLELARSHDVLEPNDKYHAVISYLTNDRGVDVNALKRSEFSIVMECLNNVLLHICSVFSTPETNVFLHAKLSDKKINLLWKTILRVLPANVYSSGSADVIRSFIRYGFDVKEALYRVEFSDSSLFTPETFIDLLEILEIFMDHGARRNPRPGSNEKPFLQRVMHCYDSMGDETRPKLFGFIKKCIQRGVDPKSSFTKRNGRKEDLFLAVCDYYEEDDKNQLIEYLCDCGADASLYRNNGLDLWLRLSRNPEYSEYKVTSPSFNEILLLLLRRGLRTDCIDRKGNSVLHMYFRLYSDNLSFENCCRYYCFRELDDLKFWDLLDALLDAGAQVNHVNKKGETPLRAFKRIMPRGYLRITETVCFECREFFFRNDVSAAINVDAELTRVRKCMDRLSPISS